MTTTEVTTMPKVTLYVKDADEAIWERARKIAGESLSAIVSQALAEYVAAQEQKAAALETLREEATTHVLDHVPEDGPARKVRFTGILVHEFMDSGLHTYEFYLTTSGKVIEANDVAGLSAIVYDSYEDFTNKLPATNHQYKEAAAAIAQALGEEWIEDVD